MMTGKLLKDFIRRITRIGADSGDSNEVQTRKAILVGANFLGITFGGCEVARCNGELRQLRVAAPDVA
jgi:hypothetical protein